MGEEGAMVMLQRRTQPGLRFTEAHLCCDQRRRSTRENDTFAALDSTAVLGEMAPNTTKSPPQKTRLRPARAFALRHSAGSAVLGAIQEANSLVFSRLNFHKRRSRKTHERRSRKTPSLSEKMPLLSSSCPLGELCDRGLLHTISDSRAPRDAAHR